MTYAKWLFVVLLCCALIVPVPAEAVEATYCFGKVELLRQGNQEWEFLKRGTSLNSGDRLRTPPVSILRLMTTEGISLPTFTGAREATVAQLLQEGHKKLEQLRRYRMEPSPQGEAAIDVLPTGSPSRVAENAMKAERAFLVDSQTFQQLLVELPQVPPHLDRQAREWLSQVEDRHYASRTMQIVPLFHDRFLGDLESPLTASGIRDYLHLLVAAGVEVKPEHTAQGELLLLINTQVPAQASRTLTVNRELVYSADSQVWIPLQISTQPQSFISAWYHGARILHATQVED